MSVEDNKTIIRQHFEETVGKGNFEIYRTTFAPHMKYHIKGMHTHGHESYFHLIKEFHQAMHGRIISVDDLVGEGDKVVARFSVGGTHGGHFREHGPTHD